MTRIIQRPCWPGNRCRLWRTCETCGRIRQARIANAGERVAAIAGSADWTTLTQGHASMASITKARAEFLRKAEPEGAIWTIEQSPQTGSLHCNILHTPCQPPELRHSSIFHVPSVASPRAVAAYISKAECAPDPDYHKGRAYGTAGPLWQWIAGKNTHVIAQAAALQTEINRESGRLDMPTHGIKQPNHPDLTADEYRAIAARRLPDLLPRRVQN